MKRDRIELPASQPTRKLGLTRKYIKPEAPVTTQPVEEELKIEDIKFETSSEKNICMKGTDSKGACFLVEFRTTNRSAKTDLKGNGVLVVKYNNCFVQNMESKIVAKSDLTRDPVSDKIQDGEECKQMIYIKKTPVYLYTGNTVKIQSKAIMIKNQLPMDEYDSGQIFLATQKQIEEKINDENKPKSSYILRNVKGTTGFVTPFLKKCKKRRVKLNKPLHSPHLSDSFVLFEPTDIFSENKIHVVVEPILSSKLRPHQKEGVKFCFECLAGLRTYGGSGCILADDMGLGKTIQAITVIWTLLTQGPTGNPIAKKCVIVAPSSLVGNWCQEFKKWLPGFVEPIPMGDANKAKVEKALARFEATFHEMDNNILVTSYDQLRIHIKEVLKIGGIDLVVCDEGHRLKNATIKTAAAVNMIPTRRRLLLSGTPIQNDLSEFHAMVSFVNPGILGDTAKFKRAFSEEIDRMRQPDSTPEEKQVGKARAQHLSKLTKLFILRRTAQVNQQYLPPKVDNLVFCKLTPLQSKLYQRVCKQAQTVVLQENTGRKGRQTSTFSAITHLKKLCNDPGLIYEIYKEEFSDSPEFDVEEYQPQFSGKLQFVDLLLGSIRKTSKDKVVIVSNYVETLGLLAKMCDKRGYPFFQLDGSTRTNKRQNLVNEFNEPNNPEFVFLLSSKAGGCGLNLVGANHLILFDPDWNPANDAQAMARVWRPGQQKKVFLYRTLSTGTIEEKVFQRQVAKLSLASNIVEGDVDVVPDFSDKELKELFNYKDNTLSDTHDLLNCPCSKAASKIPMHKRKAASVDELINWKHFPDSTKLTEYPNLQKSAKSVSFVFLKEYDPTKETKKKTKQLKKEKLNFGAEIEDEEEDAQYSIEEEDNNNETEQSNIKSNLEESNNNNSTTKDGQQSEMVISNADPNSHLPDDSNLDNSHNDPTDDNEDSNKEDNNNGGRVPPKRQKRPEEEESNNDRSDDNDNNNGGGRVPPKRQKRPEEEQSNNDRSDDNDNNNGGGGRVPPKRQKRPEEEQPKNNNDRSDNSDNNNGGRQPPKRQKKPNPEEEQQPKNNNNNNNDHTTDSNDNGGRVPPKRQKKPEEEQKPKTNTKIDLTDDNDNNDGGGRQPPKRQLKSERTQDNHNNENNNNNGGRVPPKQQQSKNNNNNTNDDKENNNNGGGRVPPKRQKKPDPSPPPPSRRVATRRGRSPSSSRSRSRSRSRSGSRSLSSSGSD